MNKFQMIKPLDLPQLEALRVGEPMFPEGSYRRDVDARHMQLSETPWEDGVSSRLGYVTQDIGLYSHGRAPVVGTNPNPPWIIGSVGHHYDTVDDWIYAVKPVVRSNGLEGLSVSLKTYPSGDWRPAVYSSGVRAIRGQLFTVSTQSDLVFCLSGAKLQRLNDTKTSVIELSDDAPSAYNIFAFSNRLIALRSNDNEQGFAWSNSGDIRNWTWSDDPNNPSDADEVPYNEGPNGPYDRFQAGAAIGNAQAAVFRDRSIGKMFETGNINQAVGLIPWKDGIGCPYVNTIASTPWGLVFLSNERMVTLLTQSGEIIELGSHILNDLRANPNYTFWATYSYRLKEFWITAVDWSLMTDFTTYVISLSEFFMGQKEKWRRRTDMNVGAVGTTPPNKLVGHRVESTALYMSPTYIVYEVDETSIIGLCL